MADPMRGIAAGARDEKPVATHGSLPFADVDVMEDINEAVEIYRQIPKDHPKREKVRAAIQSTMAKYQPEQPDDWGAIQKILAVSNWPIDAGLGVLKQGVSKKADAAMYLKSKLLGDPEPKRMALPDQELIDAMLLRKPFPATGGYLERGGVPAEYAGPAGTAIDIAAAVAPVLPTGLAKLASLSAKAMPKLAPGLIGESLKDGLIESSKGLGKVGDKMQKLDPTGWLIGALAKAGYRMTPAIRAADNDARLFHGKAIAPDSLPSNAAWEHDVAGMSNVGLGQDARTMSRELSTRRDIPMAQIEAAERGSHAKFPGQKIEFEQSLDPLYAQVDGAHRTAAGTPGMPPETALGIKQELSRYLPHRNMMPGADNTAKPGLLRDIARELGQAAEDNRAFVTPTAATPRRVTNAAKVGQTERALRSGYKRLGGATRESLSDALMEAEKVGVIDPGFAREFRREGRQAAGLIDIADHAGSEAKKAFALTDLLTGLQTYGMLGVGKGAPMATAAGRVHQRGKTRPPTEWELIQQELDNQKGSQ